jgi:tetratricopeptide (TPR) repeat protein
MLALTEAYPDSEERAIALALLASQKFWLGDPDAAPLAAQALDLARKVGSDTALFHALGMVSETRLGCADCLEYSRQAVAHARSTGSNNLLAHAGIAQYNCLVSLGQRANAADVTLGLVRELVSRGAFYESVGLISGAAGLLIDLGRWAEAREVLQEGLGRRIDSEDGADIRRVAADLAARRGDLAAASHHLARAAELSPIPPVVGFAAVATAVRVAWAAGDQPRALARSEEAMPVIARIDEDTADDVPVWSARVAADLAEKGERPRAVAWLERIEALRAKASEPFRAHTSADLIHPAWGVLRCRPSTVYRRGAGPGTTVGGGDRCLP